MCWRGALCLTLVPACSFDPSGVGGDGGVSDAAPRVDAPSVLADASADPDAPFADAAPSPDADPPDAGETGPVTVTFRQGLSGYNGTLDTYLFEGEALEAQDGGSIDWDNDPPDADGDRVGLLRFLAIIGSGGKQIPEGAVIDEAILTLEVIDGGTNPKGEVREVAVEWNESSTWASFGAVPGVQAGDVGTKVADAPAASGSHDLDVTASVQAWANDPTSNRGWAFLPGPNNADRVRVRSSEQAPEVERPTLTVTYDTAP